MPQFPIPKKRKKLKKVLVESRSQGRTCWRGGRRSRRSSPTTMSSPWWRFRWRTLLTLKTWQIPQVGSKPKSAQQTIFSFAKYDISQVWYKRKDAVKFTGPSWFVLGALIFNQSGLPFKVHTILVLNNINWSFSFQNPPSCKYVNMCNPQLSLNPFVPPRDHFPRRVVYPQYWLDIVHTILAC